MLAGLASQALGVSIAIAEQQIPSPFDSKTTRHSVRLGYCHPVEEFSFLACINGISEAAAADVSPTARIDQ